MMTYINKMETSPYIQYILDYIGVILWSLHYFSSHCVRIMDY